MTLSDLEQDGSLALAADGQTKTVTMLTDAQAVPYSAFYDMPDGYVPWLTITVTNNLFIFTAQNNLFSEEPRTVRVRFHCQATSGGAWQEKIVDVVQAKDSVSITFDPAQAVFSTPEKSTINIALTGLPTGGATSFSSPGWITTDLVSEDQLDVIADANESDEERSGTIQVSVNGRMFYIPVSQAANDYWLSFDPEDVDVGHSAGTTEITVAGIPVGVTPAISSSVSWMSAILAGDTLTITVKENKGADARTGEIALTIAGRRFALPVRQGVSPYASGVLTLDVSSFQSEFLGGSVVVTATEKPAGEEGLTCTVNIEGKCVACRQEDSFVTPVTLGPDKIQLNVAAQNVFDGEERVATVVFKAGGAVASVTVTQDAPPTVHRLKGFGDKFVKNVASLALPTALAEVTTIQLYDELKLQDWERPVFMANSVLVASSWDDIISSPNKYDAYKAGFARKEEPFGMSHRVTMGAVVYRFKFNQAAYGQELRGLSFFVRTDGYCAAGLRVALEITTDDGPSGDWNAVRQGTNDFSRTRAAQRVFNEQNGLFYGATQNVVFDGLKTLIDASTRIYVYVTMEDYKGVMGGHVYGSGILVPDFDFYVDELEDGLSADDIITDTELSVTSSDLPISEGGFIASPRVTRENDCVVRGLMAAELLVGTSNVLPTDAMAFASLPSLFATVAKQGMVRVDMKKKPYTPWVEGQNGLVASVGRHIGGPTSPYANLLRYTISPLIALVSGQPDDVFKKLRITHRVGEPTQNITGALVAVSLYWFSEQTLDFDNFEEIATMSKLADGVLKINTQSLTGEMIGETVLPGAIPGGTSLTIPFRTMVKGWGSLLLLPRVTRITADTFVLGTQLGLTGIDIDDDRVTGAGWFPNLKLEV